jgi:hypothetical protein
MEVFWLIGFAGWKAIECYSPHVVVSASTGQTIADLIKSDHSLARACPERASSGSTDLDCSGGSHSAPWPPDLPRPTYDRNLPHDAEYKTAFDLTCTAVGVCAR